MYTISQVSPADRRAQAQSDGLLEQEGIRRDANLDYVCAMYDGDGCVIATGSCFGNTLRCFAVSREHQGEGLLNQLVAHLMQVQLQRGNLHLFVYTKTESARFFQDLGFHCIAQTPGRVSFLENRRAGFPNFLQGLVRECGGPTRSGAAVVMNANPFISSATFPSYFLQDSAQVSRSHAELDAAVFGSIAQALGITRRYLGDEPASGVTALYNQVLAERLPAAGVECAILPRRQAGRRPISASTVRQCIHDGRWDALEALLPETTLAYFRSAAAADVIRRIQDSRRLIHH